MTRLQQQKFARILFDEFHSESWTISETRAKQMQPDRPGYSSYQQAAHALAGRDFDVLRNLDRPLTTVDADVLALLHPCDSKWERTTGGSPRLSTEELENIVKFVEQGGGLLVVTEYEHEKYGDNLNDLLAHFGMEIENTTIFDQQACVAGNPAWFFADVAAGNPGLMHGVEKVCFYQAGSSRGGSIALSSRSGAGLVALAQSGKGRVVLITDSLLFGDEHFQDFSHRQLWLNLIYWLSAPAFHKPVPVIESKSEKSAAWSSLKGAINALRDRQNPDGTLPADHHDEARHLTQTAVGAIQQLAPAFPHERDYLDQVTRDLDAWVAGGFQKPDFTKSLGLFDPQTHRRDGLEHLWVMPMYTPNASSDWRFEALIYRVPWPDWLAELERVQYQNDKIVPGHLVDYTAGYASECAVLFPETVQVAGKGSNNFATIFCDREASRYQRVVSKAAKITQLDMHPQLECFLNSLPMIQDTYALWDLIHDKSHSVGELPFDPFMIRQRAPFWMYGLEELRVDLRAFAEATRLAQEDFPFAHYVRYAILFDRIFRFPITGLRVRNYDGLGGQLLFSYLHQRDVLVWHDNRLTVRWGRLDEGMDGLRQELLKLYKFGSDASKMNFWLAAHDLVSNYVPPNVASKWKKDTRTISDESDPKRWIDLVHPDEFPLGSFHANLQKKMARA
jgi:hypothetical protein